MPTDSSERNRRPMWDGWPSPYNVAGHRDVAPVWNDETGTPTYGSVALEAELILEEADLADDIDV